MGIASLVIVVAVAVVILMIVRNRKSPNMNMQQEPMKRTALPSLPRHSQAGVDPEYDEAEMDQYEKLPSKPAPDVPQNPAYEDLSLSGREQADIDHDYIRPVN